MTPIELYYIIYLLFGISITTIIIVWNSQLHKNPKFKFVLNLVAALTILFTSFAIILQLYTFHAQQQDTEINMYETLFNNLIDRTMNYFEKNPKMNYLYKQMFRPENEPLVNPVKRYKVEEQQMIRSLLNDLSALIYYLETVRTMSKDNQIIIKQKVDIFISLILRSPIFVENFQELKSTLFSIKLVDYFQKNYNI
jgi:ABC-type multidrug transport system fused ATPase/permease subunit